MDDFVSTSFFSSFFFWFDANDGIDVKVERISRFFPFPRNVLHWSENHSNDANNGNNIALGERKESHALQLTSNPFFVRSVDWKLLLARHGSMQISD